MTSKKYAVYTVSFLYVFIVINLVLWNFMTKDFLNMSEIERNSSQKLTQPLTEPVHYPLHHTNFADYVVSGRTESFDVMTLGDSFSNGQDGSSYQDYLLNQYGITSINVSFSQANGLESLYMLISSGLIDELKPRLVILESVERYVQSNLGRTEVAQTNLPRDKVMQKLPAAHASQASTVARISSGLIPPVFVQWNTNFFSNKLRYMLNPEKLSSSIYAANLDREFFTNPGYEDKLFFYYEDLNYLQEPLNAEMVNHNLNNAARLLNAKGITLIFFAAADKYDLYSPYILDKKGRPENTSFQKMRDVQGKEYIYVDTMTILREALERGEKDVYWLDDSHWSHKGIKIFCDELVKYILPAFRH